MCHTEIWINFAKFNQISNFSSLNIVFTLYYTTGYEFSHKNSINLIYYNR